MHRKLIVILFSVMFISSIAVYVAPNGGRAASEAPTKTSGPAKGAIVWTPEMDCSVCHAKYVDSLRDSKLLAYGHAKVGLNKCYNCHDRSALKGTHSSVRTGETDVKARKYPQGNCLKCHGTYEGLAAKTANSKVLKDTKGTVVNPHDLPNNYGHKNIKECYNCHKMHRTQDPVEYCYNCHHERTFDACKSCHQ